MVELQYFETGCNENYILKKMTLKFIIQSFGIFRKKIYFETLYAQNIRKEKRLVKITVHLV